MPLINIVVALIIVGMALYLINRFIPMASSIKTILNVVVVVAVGVWVLAGNRTVGTNLQLSSLVALSSAHDQRRIRASLPAGIRKNRLACCVPAAPLWTSAEDVAQAGLATRLAEAESTPGRGDDRELGVKPPSPSTTIAADAGTKALVTRPYPISAAASEIDLAPLDTARGPQVLPPGGIAIL